MPRRGTKKQKNKKQKKRNAKVRMALPPKLFTENYKFPRHLVEILLLIVLVAHVDLFEHSSI